MDDSAEYGFLQNIGGFAGRVDTLLRDLESGCLPFLSHPDSFCALLPIVSSIDVEPHLQKRPPRSIGPQDPVGRIECGGISFRMLDACT